VAAPAGRVDHLEAVEAELGQGRGEGLVEDELLDEDGGLQQRVRLLRVLREVLVEVPQEPRVQRRVGEVVDQRAGVVPAAPERHERLRRFTADRRPPHRVVGGVHQAPARGEARQHTERHVQPVPVVVVGVLGEVRGLVLHRHAQPVARPRDPHRRRARSVQQRVVLTEPHERAGQHPRDRRLRRLAVAPLRPRARRPPPLRRPGMLRPQLRGPRHGRVLRAAAQIRLQQPDHPTQVPEQNRRHDHQGLRGVEITTRGGRPPPSTYGPTTSIATRPDFSRRTRG